MKEYKIVAVLWNDPHIVLRQPVPKTTEDLIFAPTLTVGLLFKKNKDFTVLIHTLERNEDLDEADYTVIFNGCIINIQEYGKIELRKIKTKEAS